MAAEERMTLGLASRVAEDAAAWQKLQRNGVEGSHPSPGCDPDGSLTSFLTSNSGSGSVRTLNGGRTQKAGSAAGSTRGGTASSAPAPSAQRQPRPEQGAPPRLKETAVANDPASFMIDWSKLPGSTQAVPARAPFELEESGGSLSYSNNSLDIAPGASSEAPRAGTAAAGGSTGALGVGALGVSPAGGSSGALSIVDWSVAAPREAEIKRSVGFDCCGLLSPCKATSPDAAGVSTSSDAELHPSTLVRPDFDEVIRTRSAGNNPPSRRR